MHAKSHTLALSAVVDALASCSIPVHVPPLTGGVVAAPCVLVGMPEATEHVKVGCGDPHWRFVTEVVVVSESTRGLDLASYTDEVAVLLDQSHLATTSRTTTYDLPNHPAGLPAMSLTVE